jgi:propionyl-CoA carboxylase alpha chain/3-methylcrotonyl-CoA carboxylase alpha subunit/acetyl-CoA/propionyl-CoA carboxylase biotin carboxyl carrier protein
MRWRKVLIANRGEVAVRVLATLRSHEITSAIVFHPVDARTRAVREADESYGLTGDPPVSAYLSIEQIVAAAKALGADAVHPGYGFLAENADFARALDDADIAFIGPKPETIALMGDKARARAFVASRGFPVAPSAIEEDEPQTFADRALALGLPLLIKPSAGGGGKGMRIVRKKAALGPEIETARREALRNFGDGRLLIERYIEQPRHIEVQVLGDAQGNVVHLWERECSIQRRFQKVIEEAPAPALDAASRGAICETAAGIARAVRYRGAGTVEFLYAPNGEYYFLEMNTRLQVEHPITEATTGFDLVWEQVRLAAGEPLGVTQAEIAQVGHAIECRLYAEDCGHDFRPATGRALLFRPPSGPGVRVDAGIEEGQDIGTHFDPMLAKIIVHGRDRAQAIARSRRALKECILLGVTSNAAYLERVLKDEDFARGVIDTEFLKRKADDLRQPLGGATRDALIAAAALSDRELKRALDSVPPLYAALGSWRN